LAGSERPAPVGSPGAFKPEEIQVNTSADWKKTVRLNKLLGMWAAEKLGMKGQVAGAYSDALALDTLDLERATCSAKFVRTSMLRAWLNRMSKSYA
jgi:hypothetical protein